MKYRVKVTVIDKKLYPELQQKYCTNPNSGACPCYNVGDEFVFCRDEERDDAFCCVPFWGKETAAMLSVWRQFC